MAFHMPSEREKRESVCGVFEDLIWELERDQISDS